MKKIRRPLHGISLTEVLVASVLLAFALVPVLTMVSQGTKTVRSTGRAILINSLARLVLEDLKTRKYDDLGTTIFLPVLNDPSPNSPFGAIMNLSGDVSGAMPLSETHFPQLRERLRNVFYKIDVSGDTPQPGLKTVSVIFRETQSGRTIDQHFVTLFQRERP